MKVPTDIEADTTSLFRYSQFCSNTEVNSLTLKDAITKAIDLSGDTPSKVRFFSSSDEQYDHEKL